MLMFEVVCVLLQFLFFSYAYADNTGKVIIVKGDVKKEIKGAKSNLKLNEQIPEKTKIITADRSFAKLLFPDNTQFNVGPNSQVIVQRYSQNAPGLINIINGSARAK